MQVIQVEKRHERGRGRGGIKVHLSNKVNLNFKSNATGGTRSAAASALHLYHTGCVQEQSLLHVENRGNLKEEKYTQQPAEKHSVYTAWECTVMLAPL